MTRRPAIALAILLLGTTPAWSQQVTKLCVPTSTGGCQDVAAGNGLPITGTISATSAATAASSLPTIGAGSGAFYQSLGGSLYSQPVFGSASGGGTIVDLTHGLPVNVVAGGGAGGTSSSFGAAFPATGTAIGVKNGANMVNLAADASNNLDVNLQTALPVGSNTIGAVTQASGPWSVSQSGSWTVGQGSPPWTIKPDGTAWTFTGTSANVDVTNSVTVSGTVTANQGTANATPWNENVAQFGGNAVATGTGASGNGVPRVTVSNDSAIKLWDGTNTATVKAASTSPALTDTSAVVAISPNPAPACTGVIAINQTSSTDVHTFTNVGYICSIVLVSASQQGISVIEGTGSVCASTPTDLIGGSGGTLQVPANGGFSSVAASPWLKMQASGDHLCVLQSGSGNVSGTITYADHS